MTTLRLPISGFLEGQRVFFNAACVKLCRFFEASFQKNNPNHDSFPNAVLRLENPAIDERASFS